MPLLIGVNFGGLKRVLDGLSSFVEMLRCLSRSRHLQRIVVILAASYVTLLLTFHVALDVFYSTADSSDDVTQAARQPIRVRKTLQAASERLRDENISSLAREARKVARLKRRKSSGLRSGKHTYRVENYQLLSTCTERCPYNIFVGVEALVIGEPS